MGVSNCISLKKDSSTRFRVDYRKLNHETVKDASPFPRIDESVDALSGSKYFSTLDMATWVLAGGHE